MLRTILLKAAILLAFDFFREYRGVIQTSAKQREAATRWTSIAAAIDQADNLSVAAKKKAKDSLVSAQSNLGGKADASLLKSNQVHRSVSTLQTAINSKKRRIYNNLLIETVCMSILRFYCG